MEVAKVPALEHVTAEARYTRLSSERNLYLERARSAAQLTLPNLIPAEGDNASSEQYQAFQSIGARGVNHLSAKLMLALFPPGHAFFRLSMEDYVLDELISEAGAGYEDARGEFEAAFGRMERSVLTRMEHRGHRATLVEVLKHLLVGGNALLQIFDDSGMRMHPLSAYCVKRDKAGSVVEIVVKETVARVALPEEARQIVEETEPEEGMKQDGPTRDDIDIFTRIYREGNRYLVYQEVRGRTIPGTDGSYMLGKCPWIPLRLIKADGEDYGRGYVEQYIGDLRSLEALAKAIVLFTAAAAKILIFVDDNGRVTIKMVEEAESGDILPGKSTDLSVFQLEKFADFRVAKETLDDIRGRLEEAFLLFSGVRRDAERVTAEEIRAVVQELEQTLGGVYSILGQELQSPLATVLIGNMMRAGDIPKLPEEAVKTEIITGVDALGRTADLRKLDMFVAGIAELFGPEAVQTYLRPEAYMKRRATALGLDHEGLVKSPEEIQQEREAAQAQSMAEKVGPEAMRMAGQPTPEGAA
jgi:hypothetical protein